MGFSNAATLLLACVGLYAMLSCVVAQRTHEIGFRLALGARGRDVFRLMAQQLLLFMSVVVGSGMLVVFGTNRIASSLLGPLQAGQHSSALPYGVTLTDPITLTTGPLCCSPCALWLVRFPHAARWLWIPWRLFAAIVDRLENRVRSMA